MFLEAENLSSEQRVAIESLLGRPVEAGEAIFIKAISPSTAPEWLQRSWERAKRLGLDKLSMEEIDAEIAAARKERRDCQPAVEQ